MSKNKSVGSTFDRLPCATSTRDTLFIRDLSNLTINIDRFVIVAAELGKTVTEYWSAWYEHAEKGLYSADSSRPLIKPDPNYVHDLDDVRPELFTQILVDGETEFVPDLRKIGLLGSRWIVSRKRNTNLFDLANVWKKTVFRKLDEDIAEKGGVVPETQNVNETYHSALVEAAEQISIESDNEIILHRRSISQEREHPEFGRISKSYNR
ncbi:hypothetical protein JR316_0002853 [Psilocybe cubensis]|uniref:Uncharacterized protein n=1 Tax=Psilocybe cubensis TaxID=181762 RepID=A0ACB8HEN6_PSICU|nr:hypothetical protein JR316_0002853 [Psilocybe cubensis]KAH9485936.1 hypothetical protein JR316_0002853 [Psilocybe cubensis]